MRADILCVLICVLAAAGITSGDGARAQASDPVPPEAQLALTPLERST